MLACRYVVFVADFRRRNKTQSHRPGCPARTPDSRDSRFRGSDGFLIGTTISSASHHPFSPITSLTFVASCLSVKGLGRK
jgi:hypothetical protein